MPMFEILSGAPTLINVMIFTNLVKYLSKMTRFQSKASERIIYNMISNSIVWFQR